MPDYDVLVIGGGIHGAGVAQCASALGYSVLVLEQNQIGSGTSSRSSKLIHGGLRYLESGQFSLVRESLHAREWLITYAPDLVQQVPFYIPVYKNTHRGVTKIGLGLSLYAFLGGLGKNVRFRRVPQSSWHDLDGLKIDKLRAVYQYWDAKTDDRALTQAVMHSALEFGATVCLPANFEYAVRKEDHFQVAYRYRGCMHICKTASLVNAGGPWVAQILDRIKPTVQKVKTDLVQGAHILVDGQIKQGIYYLEAPDDKRPVFVTSWENQLMVGTTESEFKGDPDDVKALETEKNYLLNVLSFYFPAFRAIKSAEIKASFAGVRVLPAGGDRFGQRSRETLLAVDNLEEPRLLTIYGGKLTTYRKTAQRVMKRLKKQLPPRSAKADTATIVLKRRT